MKLRDGGEIHVRCFGRYNSSLWDDVMAELPVLTEQDIIIVNFGAWYPRFNFNEPRVTQPQPASALAAPCPGRVRCHACPACSSLRASSAPRSGDVKGGSLVTHATGAPG